MFTVILENLNYYQISSVFIFTGNVFILTQEADGSKFLRFDTMEAMLEALFYPKCVLHLLNCCIFRRTKTTHFFQNQREWSGGA